MGPSPPPEPEVDERVIDRSGDIDQRPLEERQASERTQSRALALQQTGEADGATWPVWPRDPAHLEPRPSAEAARRRGGDLVDLCNTLQRALDKRHAKAVAQLGLLAQKIEVQEKRCVTPKLDDDLQQLRFQRQKLLLANGPQLADQLRQERVCLADLEAFKQNNRLTRDAHYPESPVLAFAILFMLVLLEGGINGVLFADTNEEGLLGGWLEAAVLATANVAAAFLLGRLLLPQLHRRGFFVRALALAATVAGLGVLVAINLAGAHYRDFKAALSSQQASLARAVARKDATPPSPAKPGAAAAAMKLLGTPPAAAAVSNEAAVAPKTALEQDALQRALAQPLALESFTSIFLLVIGLAGATVAAWDGYKFDDPFPGFGKRHRRYQRAREGTATALRKILGQSSDLLSGRHQAIARKVDAYAQDVQALAALHHAYQADRGELKGQLEEAVADAEAEIASNARLLRRASVGDSHDLYAVSIKGLPDLSEARLKALEIHDKRLKALQKSIQREQSDVLGLFEEASAEFQKLLAEASHASLRAASSPSLAGEAE